MSKHLKEFSFVGAALWVLLAVAFCWSQSPLALSILVAGCGAFLGAGVSHFLRPQNLNLTRVWLLTLTLIVLVNQLSDLSRWLTLPSTILSGSAVYRLSDASFWFSECFLVVFLLRLTSSLKPSFISIELLVAGGTLVELFAAHRHGFVNRPYAIVDPLWSRGIDPLPVFLAFGALIALLILTLGASHSTKRGRWIDLTAMVLLVGALFLFAPLEKLKELHEPPPASGQRESEPSEEGESEGGETPEVSGTPSAQKPPQNSGQGGNSDDLSFQDAGSSSSQNPPIAVVIFRDDYTPDTGMYYFRQAAFSQYNGSKLVADTSGLFDRDVASEFPGDKPVEPEVPPLDPSLFKELETKVALLTDHAKPFALTNPLRWTAANNPDPKRFQKAFEVRSMVLDKPIAEILGRRAGSPDWDSSTWEHYTKGPEDPRYQKLLKEIVAKYPQAPQDDPLIRALMVKLWLEEVGVYSLASKHEGAEDPTADFLFGDRTGYCVFFAHAAVYLYRTAGMPARTGSGYAVEASQRGDGSSLLIPSKSAHSWPEVYIEGLGWVVLDISPARSLDPPPPPSDPGLQQMLGEMARQDPEEPPPDEAEEKFDLQEALKNVALLLVSALPYILLAFLLLAYLKKLHRRFEPWLCPSRDLPDATLRSLLDLLADGGVLRKKGEPREAFSRRLQTLSPSFHRLTQAHMQHRLGHPQSQADYPWKKVFLDARHEIKENSSTPRRMRGMLNPISWMKVH